MSFFTSSPARAANRSTRVDSFVDYEARPDDITMDTTYSSSQDGRRSVRSAVNISPRKRRLLPSELDDLSQWTPLADESGGVDGTEAEGSSTETGSKRKWYDSSDDPMKLWRPMLGFFLDEMLRHEGLGGARSACAQCTKPLCGTFLQCRSCVLERHQVMPLHVLEEWKGCYWTTVTLSSLDLVYQLGHGDWPCPHPAPATRSMVVLDFPHIHEQLLRNAWYPATTVDPGTCATFATLEVFRLLTVIGALSVLDFVGTMEKSTNPSGDRYRAFGRMSRQFSFLGRLKRGECAVRCWACPQEGVNLPEGWKDVAPEFQFLFMLILAVDANFRMRNRLRSNAYYDPPLGSGVDQHLCRICRSRTEGDTTNNGLARLWRRYSGIALLYLAICYDIVCQWKIKFRERMAAMPENMRLDLNKTTVVFRASRTDGEGTERVWSEMNWGAREDHIEDKVDYHNNQKNLRHGSTLARKLVIAIDERDRQIAGFEDVDRTLKPELRAEWQGMIDAWVANKDEKNPYQLDASENVTSEASIRRTLAKEELDEVATGKTTLHGSSVTSFLVMGLQLEAAQDRIRRESKARPLLPGEQNELVSGLRRGFFVKLRKFRRLQGHLYACGGRRISERDAEELAEKEARLRDGQLHDNIRRLPLMVHVSTTIETIAGRYRRARQALVALRGEEGRPEWRALEDDDIRLDQEREAGRRSQCEGRWLPISSKNRKMSWIWTQGGGPDDDEQELVDAVRVEWCMAKARRDRWVEEVSLLREEMPLWWEERRTMTREVMPEIKEGVQAYAARQAVISRQIARQFKREWGTSVSAAVRIALDTDAALGLYTYKCQRRSLFDYNLISAGEIVVNDGPASTGARWQGKIGCGLG
ncbi:CxC2 domain-containing protein [Favolaschia claudopus]|uniref:CxC2 domain-containing protein n=1 Tax=Favolaschia claudopus TaxID=2862362 RepID=A0AAW0BLG0_9AGAR